MVAAGKDGKGKGPPPLEPGQVLGVGLQFAASILLFLFLGSWLDGKLGTSPWLLLLGVLVGSSAGFYSLYYHLVVGQRERDRKRKEQRK